jgi:hypothetical protein
MGTAKSAYKYLCKAMHITEPCLFALPLSVGVIIYCDGLPGEFFFSLAGLCY